MLYPSFGFASVIFGCLSELFAFAHGSRVNVFRSSGRQYCSVNRLPLVAKFVSHFWSSAGFQKSLASLHDWSNWFLMLRAMQ